MVHFIQTTTSYWQIFQKVPNAPKMQHILSHGQTPIQINWWGYRYPELGGEVGDVCLNRMEVSWIINFYVDINKYSGPELVCGVSYSWERQDCTVMYMPKSRQCGCWQEQTLWLPSSKMSTQSVWYILSPDRDFLRVLSLMLRIGRVCWYVAATLGSLFLAENGLLLLHSLRRTRGMNCYIQYTHK